MADTSTEMPQVLETERAVIASCLTQESWWAYVEQYDDDPLTLFWDVEHQALARSMKRLHDRGTSITPTTMIDMISSDDNAEKIIGPNVRVALSQLQLRATVRNIEDLNRSLEELVNMRALRSMLDELDSIKDRASSGDVHPSEIAGDLRSLSGKGSTTLNLRTLGEIIAEMEEQNKIGPRYRVPTGIQVMDEALRGFEPGRVYVYGARPKVGKTMMMMNNALEALASGTIVLFVSLEMPPNEVWARMLSAQSFVDYSMICKWLEGEEDISVFDDEAQESLLKANKELREAPLYIIGSQDISRGVSEIISGLLSLMSKHGKDARFIVFLDYLQLMVEDKFNAAAEIGTITRRLKREALALDVPFVLACQVNRQAEDGMPRPSHLRESGAIEQDADAVLLMNRPHLQDEDEPEHLMNVHLAISRYCPSKWMDVAFLPQQQTVTDLHSWGGDRSESEPQAKVEPSANERESLSPEERKRRREARRARRESGRESIRRSRSPSEEGASD